MPLATSVASSHTNGIMAMTTASTTAARAPESTTLRRAASGLKLDFGGWVPDEPLGEYTWRVLSRVPDIVALGGALLYGIYWITKRREYVQSVEGEHGGKERS